MLGSAQFSASGASMSEKTRNVAGLEVSERTARMMEASAEVSTGPHVIAMARGFILISKVVRILIWAIPIVPAYWLAEAGQFGGAAFIGFGLALPVAFVTWIITLVVRGNEAVLRRITSDQ